MKIRDKGPFKVIISFRLLKEKFEALLASNNLSVQKQAEQALELFTQHPKLITGTDLKEDIQNNTAVLDQLMSFVFPTTLTNNEIKAAVTPYTNEIFYCSSRLQNIINKANTDENIFIDLYKDYEDSFDLFIYAIILNVYYKYQVDFERPKTLSITDKNGERKRYRVAFNADFIDIYPNKNAIEITKEILDELLTNADKVEVWEKYFPKNSWTIEGFGIVNLFDTSLDERIDDFKTHLIEPNTESFQYLMEDIRRIFNIPDLQLGSYSVADNVITPPFDRSFDMLTILPNEKVGVGKYACNHINNGLFKDCKPVIISNVETYHKQTNGNRLSKILLDRGLKSAALIPIPINGELGFIVELAAFKPNQLNAINMVKLDAIMPFILSYSRRTYSEYQNEISAVIQQECTAIHPSVEWRFQEEARQYIQERNYGENPVFHEIVFKDVVPLFGQVDVVGSSNARNEAIKLDLTKQLEISKKLLIGRTKINLPFYEQLIFQIDNYLASLNDNFTTNSEHEISLFFEKQLIPLFEHFLHNSKNKIELEEFLKSLDKTTNSLYLARKSHDETIKMGNEALATFLEKQQIKAQAIFPHYFEKFKTDGVEHNLYVGQSITKQFHYHPTVLYNLRLWQLQVTCEMEAMYYEKQKEFPLQLEVASLILAYNEPISIRYRMDEKQFDVDGAYNVRFEMIKKRIDKAHIKNTNERLTQAHKLCVVYSSKEIEREYLSYFEFLQAKNYVGQNIELLELEELQGASGLKAIRVDLNKELQKVSDIFTLEDIQAV
ncbi:hypothetical protein [Xanthomarina sp. F2636L]|uniref:hypothetical protein n=1 Tax=Xanthomarina sp. F2636L TaxID=2996018 RepID=UPI00225E3394|nr:hypothetical protein [Xanthomarina sp. F2636L]MCX7549949.1 hypothetical protein [Xanthomarina sp. F2636L]